MKSDFSFVLKGFVGSFEVAISLIAAVAATVLAFAGGTERPASPPDSKIANHSGD